MPRIVLKPGSPEFAEEEERPSSGSRVCDMPGCGCEGLYKAPRDRSLDGHYRFCLEHIQEYNRSWDFFSGMSQSDIESHIYGNTVWERPTRPFGVQDEAELLRKAQKTYGFSGQDEKREQNGGRQDFRGGAGSPEFEALAIMGLAPPVDLVIIKARYRELARKYHPDHNSGNPHAEEIFKKVNGAYATLRVACEKYERLNEV